MTGPGVELEALAAARHYRTFDETDDDFHDEVLSEHWWETETAWFSWHVAERRMGGWVYAQCRPNARLCNGGTWVWDDSAAYSWDLRYHAEYAGLAMPPREERDLRDFTWPTGVRTTTLEPLTAYRLRYEDPGALEFDLVFEAVMAPNPHPEAVAPFYKGVHFDQAGRVRGSMVLEGEPIDVDCLSVRDRSWGPRPMGPSRRRGPGPSWGGVGYSFATASEREAWLVYAVPGLESDSVSCGFLLRQGVYGHLLAGERRLEIDRRTGWPLELEIEAVDDRGRRLEVRGSALSRHWRGNGGDSLVRWTWDGLEGWGEDQTYLTRALRRAKQERA